MQHYGRDLSPLKGRDWVAGSATTSRHRFETPAAQPNKHAAVERVPGGAALHRADAALARSIVKPIRALTGAEVGRLPGAAVRVQSRHKLGQLRCTFNRWSACAAARTQGQLRTPLPPNGAHCPSPPFRANIALEGCGR